VAVPDPGRRFRVFSSKAQRQIGSLTAGLPQPRVPRYLARPIRPKWHVKYEPLRESANRSAASHEELETMLHGPSQRGKRCVGSQRGTSACHES
jgi:Uri superfamily endonuclease